MPPQTGHLDVYFFISHVRTMVPNKWISAYYEDLRNAVEQRASPKPGLRPESIYLDTRAVAERRRAAGDLASARVFVPLYTPEYLDEVPPEFDEYVHGDPARGGRAVIHPVLWNGDFGIRNAPGLSQARDLGGGIAMYGHGGLSTMCRLKAYAASYQKIIDRLADRIVDAAENPGNMPTWVREDSSMIIEATRTEPFVVSVLSPRGRQWNPFGYSAPHSVIEYAAEAARAHGLRPEIQDCRTTRPSRQSPGVVLVDVRSLEHEQFRPVAEEILRDPPRWSSFVVIAEQHGPDQDSRLLELLTMVGDTARGPVDIVASRRQYNQVISKVVPRNRNNFLHDHPSGRPPEA